MYSIALVCFEFSEINLIVKFERSKNVCTCQRSAGPFDDDCESGFYSIMVKTNKRSEDHVYSGRILLNALEHYNIVKEMWSSVFLF